MAAGDAETAAIFVRRYQARVYGLAFTLVGSSAMAEEIAQEAFLRAWRHADAYDPRKGRAISWLLTITRNLAVDAMRLRGEWPVDPHTLLTTLIKNERANPSAATFEDTEELRAALRALPPEQSTPIVLSAFYGLTASEIADREQIPVGTAKTRLRRGLAKLREALGVTND
jgi:RNA polymerase sigma-70 factor (ECF subfamily)